MVMTAIEQDPTSFDGASEELRNDFNFVRICVKKNALVFRNVSQALRSNKEIILCALDALEKDFSLFEYIVADLCHFLILVLTHTSLNEINW
ncbi:hypothetical protein C9374_005656 [Naegleria lovaniensis]|uniref:DUF4116 domain-containing protein n=1 Tax=Naegleria lovaniensis TaxID=51637 RepID=A0AA88GMT3_NAELO|nr:uncharacterized protein C9374_005656 [Naegleria lovaniensis]KAG2381864.1 hypothetical protein C9374_005656 [Naegleria lovaniensis]